MNFRMLSQSIVLMSAVGLLSSACHSSDKKEKKQGSIAILSEEELQEGRQAKQPSGLKAYAVINPAEGFDIAGVVSFTEVEGGIRIVADVAGLKPGLHGFHIHEHGDCGGEGTANAGGHYNPTNRPHGGPDSSMDQRHVGDLGNLEANADGIAHYNRIDSIISLKGEHSIIGKSVIVHADPDDLKTQPTGNAGKKVGCGVIVEKK
jgi:superoxide dismutase, Cu-Zn family